MERLRHKIILNPTAGKGKAGERLAEIRARLAASGLDFDIAETKGVWHAAELARDAGREGYGAVVAAGGDGTVNEVVNGLMLARERGEEPPAMGVLSVGRGNDFSYGADVPASLADCVEVLVRGRRRPMDVGRVTGGDYPKGRHFANGVGIGFDTIVGLEAAKMKRVHGAMAYVLGAAKTFVMYPEAPALRIDHDGGRFEQRSHMVSIMNGKRLGGVFFMTPEAKNHDGLLDLCMTERLTRRQIAALIPLYTKGEQAGHPLVKTARSARYAIAAPAGGLVVHADGETICVNGAELLVECLPSMISMICAPGDDGAGGDRAN